MPGLVTWSESLAIGIPEIDGHHKGLITLLNELHESVHRRRGVDACRAAVEKLRDYSQTHFAVEMNLMQAAGVTGWREDSAEQRQLIELLDNMIARMDEANSNITFHGLHQLKVMVLRHVRGAVANEHEADDAASGKVMPLKSFRLAFKGA